MKKHTIDTKLKAVLALETGHPIIDIATPLGIAPTQLYRWRNELIRKGLVTQDSVVSHHSILRPGKINAQTVSITLNWTCPSCFKPNTTTLFNRFAPAQCSACHRGLISFEPLMGKGRFYAMSRLFPKRKPPCST